MSKTIKLKLEVETQGPVTAWQVSIQEMKSGNGISKASIALNRLGGTKKYETNLVTEGDALKICVASESYSYGEVTCTVTANDTKKGTITSKTTDDEQTCNIFTL